MNKIIYLEPDEEIINIVDRLKSISEKKIALVVPSGAVLISSAINLRLLQEESKKLGKEISMVTTDETGRNIASQLGFTVYENLGDAREIRIKDQEEQERPLIAKKRISEEKLEALESEELEDGYSDIDEEEEGEGERKVSIFDDSEEDEEDEGYQAFSKKSVNQEKKLEKSAFHSNSKNNVNFAKKKVDGLITNPKAWIYGIIGFVVVLFLLVFIFPKATVYLNVNASEETLDIGFKLATDTQSVSKVENKTVLPAKWESKDQEVTIELPTTGTKNVGDKAKGTIVIYNRSGRTVSIAAGTEFLTSDNKRFVIPKAASVPGAMVSDFGEMIPGKSSTDLEAAEGGTAFNIKPSRFYVPSLAEMVGNLVYGQTEDSMSGGTDKDAKVVSKDDIDKAKQMAKDEMEKKLSEQFGMTGERIFVKGMGIVENSNEALDKKEGDEADKLTMKVSAKFSFLTFSKTDFDKMFEDSLKLHISNQKELVGSGYRNVTWVVVSFDDKKKTGEILAHATVLTATSINQDFLKSKIVTLNVQELRAVLSQYPDVELDHVGFFPPLLVQSIPSNERNVNIVVNHVEK
ncbi:MAG: hypothetical protein PHU42_04075 [Patescibacteria group bacterium]|nr:hypothetical protein [Patescibacteria group bacterium]